MAPMAQNLPLNSLLRCFRLRGRLNHRIGVAVLAAAASTVVWFEAGSLPAHGRIALIIFLFTGIGWILTPLNDTTIAFIAVIAMMLSGIVPKADLFAAFGDEIIWFLVAAFVISAVIRETGLTIRVAFTLLSTASSVRNLFYIITIIITSTTLVIPSTSGRAALMLPVFMALVESMDNRRFRRALALLFPSVVLLSAGGSLIGAGAHLVAIGYVANAGGQAVGYLRWLVLGMPLALLCCLFATEVILRLFLSGDECRAAPRIPEFRAGPIGLQQRYVGVVILLTVGLWATSAWHGVPAAIVAFAAALAVTLPSYSGVPLKTALRTVEWELIMFLAATLVMGRALIASGAAQWLAGCLLAQVKDGLLRGPATVAAFVAVVSVLAHLVITSRTARVTILVPTLVLPVVALGYNPTALVFLCTVGTGFCQTLPISAKPVALYGNLEEPTYDARDLLRLSAVLMPIVTLLLFIFALWVWPLMGMSVSI